MSAARTIVFAAGGTGGHVYPAVAVAEELAAYEDFHPLFLGSSNGVESRVVLQYGYAFRQFHAAPFERTGMHGKVRCAASLARGFLEVRRILREVNAAAVVAFGGYVSVAPVLAARSLGIPTLLHEANAEFGLANRLLVRKVSALLASFDTVASSIPGAEVVGMPVRLAIRAPSLLQEPPAEENGQRLVLVLSGTEPSAFFSERVPALLARVARSAGTLRVLHQTASSANAPVAERYRHFGIDASVTDYILDIASAYQRASFVISRVGASTMAEIALSGIPAMMVPDPGAAANHQVRNAALFRERGGVLTVREDEWNEEALARDVTRLLTDPSARRQAILRLRKLAHPAAASTVANRVAGLAGARNSSGR